MLREVGVFEAKSQLSALSELVAGGHGIFITKHGKRIAELRPVEAPRKKAKFGCAQGRGFQMAPNFDAPLDCFGDQL